MPKLNINLAKIKYNAQVLQSFLASKDINFTPVVTAIAGDREILKVLKQVGLTEIADSRLANIQRFGDPDVNFILLKSHAEDCDKEIIQHVKISVQTELTSIYRLNEVAQTLGTTHQIVLMVDWKDGREGVLTYDVLQYLHEIMSLKHIKVIGLAFNFMSFKSEAPSDDDIFTMNQFICAVEKELGYRLKLISGGNSSMLPQLMYNDLGKINDLRIGDTLFRGENTTSGQPMPNLYQHAITLEAQIIEIKPRVNMETKQSYLQAIVNIGYIDTVTNNIQPMDKELKIKGASSDYLMIDLNNQDGYQLGDTITFTLGHEALTQSMYMRHLEKNYVNDDLINALIANFDENTMRQCHQHHQHLKN
ncbi:alanine racemase [Staphylococcus lugdunensis]|uniref:alanine racemase n=1 Tax=Staphylococcus lugdunensis TaxID=28035 RepID=UPI001F4D0ED6|nr:alanine racemase [Staphylococcus lugdunensis]MCH8647483.1 alanine racemase [Staphylococcus lugdunensis]